MVRRARRGTAVLGSVILVALAAGSVVAGGSGGSGTATGAVVGLHTEAAGSGATVGLGVTVTAATGTVSVELDCGAGGFWSEAVLGAGVVSVGGVLTEAASCAASVDATAGDAAWSDWSFVDDSDATPTPEPTATPTASPTPAPSAVVVGGCVDECAAMFAEATDLGRLLIFALVAGFGVLLFGIGVMAIAAPFGRR